MGTYSQAERAFRVDTPLGEDELLLEAFWGEESVSQPFEYTLELLSENDSVNATDLLRQPVNFSVRLADDSDRFFHGYVSRFEQLGKSEDLSSYELEVVPWLWFLSLTQDCRVFQQMTVLEITEEVFRKYDEADYEVKCVGSYPKREYCVQYRESDLDFVSRLLEEEGIYYFCQHSADAHRLVLVDDASMLEPCAVQSAFRVATTPEVYLEEDVITEIRRELIVNTERVTLRDYDYAKPSNNLEASQGSDSGGEIYDYPGSYVELSDGERYATLQLEEQAADQEIIRGTSTCRTMATGFTCDLKDYYIGDANKSYLAVAVWHTARGGGYRTGQPETDYSNRFECVPTDVPYRPPHRTTKPVVRGCQTAVVVGPAGEEIYTDAEARVKVQFHWDRLGEKNENSSCWVRVASPWAGKGYGAVTIPRIGNEALVDFLEGNPDRPIIVGSVYNADQTPPHGKIEMGIKSRSSKGGGGYNQITVEDTKGTELITIHGQFDMNTTVEHDQTETIGNDQTESVGHDRKRDVGNDETVTIGSNLKRGVGKSATFDVGMNRTRTVRINESVTVGAAQEIAVGAARAVAVGADQDTEVGNNRQTKVGKDDSLEVGKNLVIDAGDQITIKTGKASITMKKDGTIAISGKDISVKGSGKIDLKASKDITMKGKKILQN